MQLAGLQLEMFQNVIKKIEKETVKKLQGSISGRITLLLQSAIIMDRKHFASQGFLNVYA